MVKSPDAFRTISEVADWLGIQAHVLRFWESKFTQVKPIKRAGGRRYYRPADMLLLGGIKKLLHDDGLTIKGVQKILREDGMTHVSSLSAPLDEAGSPEPEAQMVTATPPERETGVVLKFGATAADQPAVTEDPPQAAQVSEPEPDQTLETASGMAQATTEQEPPQDAPLVDHTSPARQDDKPSQGEASAAPSAYSPMPPEDDHPRATPDPLAPSDATTQDAPRLAPATEARAEDEPDAATSASAPEPPEEDAASTLPDFLQHPLMAEAAPVDEGGTPPSDQAAKSPAPKIETADPGTSPKAPDMDDDKARPAVLDLPAFTQEADFPAQPGLLSRIAQVRRLPRHVQPDVATLLLDLADIRARMDTHAGAGSNY